MGNKKKADKWLPSDPLRIKGFARLLAAELYVHNTTTKPRVNELKSGIENHKIASVISPTTLRNWVNGEDFPSEGYRNLIEKISPTPLQSLKPSIDSTPILRFLCALDIWGSRLNSPALGSDKVTHLFSAGACLEKIAKHWAPYELVIDNKMYGTIIPKIKHFVPGQVNYLKYRAYDRFSILEFMFECGGFIDFHDDDFEDWSIDLASTALSIKASIDSTSSSKQSLSGEMRDLSNLIYAIFFNTNNVFYAKRLSQHLARKYPDFIKKLSINYAERLISARSILENKLLTFGCNLSIANELSEKIPDKDLAFQKIELDDRPYEPELLRHLTEDSSLLERKIKTNFIYTFKVVRKKRIVTFKEEESDIETVLPLRNDLFDDHLKSPYLWGYGGSGPRLLAASIIAHHLGHNEFGSKKAIRLVENVLSKFTISHDDAKYFLTTWLINDCINSC